MLPLAATLFAAVGAASPAEVAPPTSTPARYQSSPVDTAHGDREFLLLWPDGAPGAVGAEPQDRPKLTVYRAPAEVATGAAAVVCPGGSYRTLASDHEGRQGAERPRVLSHSATCRPSWTLASDHEGRQVAEWLNTLGLSAFVLQYRVGPRYGHPAPLQDGQRALRLVRARAKDFAVDPTRVGIVGFSAGGHLAATTGTHFDDGKPQSADAVERMGSRPDFMVLGYPVISLTARFTHRGSRQSLLGDTPDPRLEMDLSNELRVSARTPPAFLFHTADDATVPVENSLAFAQALHDSHVPFELVVFPRGRHGLGLAPDDPVVSGWPKLCAAWLRSMGLLDRPRGAGAQ